MRPRNLLFAISMAVLLLTGCGDQRGHADCKSLTDSLVTEAEHKMDSISSEIRELVATNDSMQAVIASLRDSIRLADTERKRMDSLLDRNVFHEPPIRF
jgi:outer membrane murein-binding lipoprotein Lpp